MNTIRPNEEELNKTIRENIVKLRKDNGLTQEDVARITGKKKATVGSWEQGVSTPDIFTISKLANHYGVTMEHICGKPERKEAKAERLQTYAQGVVREHQKHSNELNLFELFGFDEYGNTLKKEYTTKQAAEELRDATLAYAKKLTEIIEKMDG